MSKLLSFAPKVPYIISIYLVLTWQSLVDTSVEGLSHKDAPILINVGNFYTNNMYIYIYRRINPECFGSFTLKMSLKTFSLNPKYLLNSIIAGLMQLMLQIAC